MTFYFYYEIFSNDCIGRSREEGVRIMYEQSIISITF